ncbi:hypothetical protein GP486_001781 [Trichoglossum hirsutum]|uniref:Ankyrin repeat protein n=1 Tax=Trichoglossum hirsutum TaxID=265104 RepID=A0A9P8LGD5_9PEZI|nr:hypothetical protein GP486_001781 [Trichoglossum hirsutum]
MASRVPDRVKVQILSDAKRLAIKEDDGISPNAALQVALALGNGFGGDQDLSKTFYWAQRSADSGCFAAKLLLLLLSHQSLATSGCSLADSSGLNSVFKEQTLNSLQPNTGNLFGPLQTSGRDNPQNLNSNSSLPDEQSKTDLCKSLDHHTTENLPTTDHNSLLLACQLGDLDNLVQLASEGADIQSPSSNGCVPLHYLFMFDQSEFVLNAVLGSLLPSDSTAKQSILERRTLKPYILSTQLPFQLVGTPLSFAAATGARTAVKVLLRAGADPLQGYRSQSKSPAENLSAIEIAISFHHADIFTLLWRSCTGNSSRSQLLSELIFTGTMNLIGSLPAQSLLEKQITHGSLRKNAQTATTVALITELWGWIAEMKRHNQVSSQDSIEEDYQRLGATNVDTNRRSIFARIFSRGLEIALALHDTEVANALITDGLKAIGVTLFELLDTAERQRLVDITLAVACPRKLNMKRSNQFIEFARCIGSDLEPPPDFQALICAIRHHNEALFANLLIAAHHLHDYDQDGRNALWHMVDSEFSSFVPLSALLSRGVDPNHGDRVGQTPLHLAALKGSPSDVRHLLEAGADVRKMDSVNSSILHNAVQSGNKTVIATLIVHLRSSDTAKEIVNCTNARGLSPLHLAILGRNSAIVRDILENGAATNAKDEKGRSPLHYLYGAGYSDVDFIVAVTGWLLCRRADPYLEDEDGTPPIHLISSMKDGDSIFKILDIFQHHSVNLDSPARDGSSLLHKAAALGNSALTSELLRRRVNMDALDETLSTPLIVCVRNRAAAVTDPMERKEVERTVQSLLAANADLGPRDRFGYTAFDYAITNSQAVGSDFASFTLNIEILKILLDSEYCTLANQSRYSSTIDFAWTLAVNREQWRAVREIMHRVTADMGSLRWPVGARLLAFAIEHSDMYLLQLFTGNPHFTLDDYRIISGREKPYQFPSDRSSRWTYFHHEEWEMKLITPEQVHGKGRIFTRNRTGHLQDIFIFVAKNHDLYKMGLFGRREYYWPIIDELVYEYKRQGQSSPAVETVNSQRPDGRGVASGSRIVTYRET